MLKFMVFKNVQTVFKALFALWTRISMEKIRTKERKERNEGETENSRFVMINGITEQFMYNIVKNNILNGFGFFLWFIFLCRWRKTKYACPMSLRLSYSIVENMNRNSIFTIYFLIAGHSIVMLFQLLVMLFLSL